MPSHVCFRRIIYCTGNCLNLFEEIQGILGQFLWKKFDDINFQSWFVPLRLPKVCSSSVISEPTADIFLIFAFLREWKQLFSENEIIYKSIEKMWTQLIVSTDFLTVPRRWKSKWARPWENVSYVICEQQRRRSACASAQSDQRLRCSLLR